MDPSESRSAKVHRVAAILAAIGDPIRLTILMCLASGELRVKDLRDIFGGSQANVSGHLKRLVAVGLVAGRRAGRETHYRVVDSRTQVVVSTATAMARARTPTPILDLLREYSHTITSNPEGPRRNPASKAACVSANSATVAAAASGLKGRVLH